MTLTIGIDLGATYSRVAVWHDNRVEVIPNNNASRATPSIVAFAGTRQLIGDSALSQINANPSNTITNAKRQLATNALLHAEFNDNIHTFAAHDVTAAILRALREAAEAYLGACARDAVITVPACFSRAQCRDTQKAAQIAGLNVLQIIRDPVATAMALGHDAYGGQTVMLVDMGGGSLDASVLKFNSTNSSFNVLATAGNSHLGGIDFDNLLLAHILATATTNPLPPSHAIHRLRIACERAKRTLSTATIATVEIDNSSVVHVTRSVFEDLCATLFDQVLDTVKKTLAIAGLHRNKINSVVLVGGSTRIPKLRQMVAGYFGNKPLCTPSDCHDETVVIGAATHAASLSTATTTNSTAI
ncbi:hypothetical protein GGI21_002752, partial [Coemansia aciculifera]